MPGQGGVPALSAFSTVWDGGRITERGDVTLWYVEALKEGMPPAIRQRINRCATAPANHDLTSKEGRRTFEQTVNDRVKIDFSGVIPHGKGVQIS